MTQLSVQIMGQPYVLSCKEGEEATLKQAVAYLDGKMSIIRDAGKIRGNDRIAVIAALGLAAELLSARAPDGPLSDLTMVEIKQEIAAMHTALDDALGSQEVLF
ncbi:cell division protein ZapA [Glaciimonas immobilis]|uniref:Cell division protein ZapA n=1 Tax=Glaciimonas immobilis TaxID=728004 RepID=A0A840RQN5_9BURK|nr:cell division protein ZapA [Glaciimonas immobilis]KAF3997580.1 cell division protein ZapA [Glaciimonas immobilis]MBB5200727.1 cell division protein ZapA [Glaciimonas immobilis]